MTDIHLEEQEDRPRSLRDPDVREHRKRMLCLPHATPLTMFAARLRQRGVGEVPDFDPLDGGTAARLLFLFEKPGPMTSEEHGGSGFISRNNDDPTAHATFDFMVQAGIPRRLTVIWNAIPWWNGTRRVTGAELRDGIMCVRELVDLLPSLAGVVLVGRRAAAARRYLADVGLPLFESVHPSPIVRASAKQKWDHIPIQWAEALAGIRAEQ